MLKPQNKKAYNAGLLQGKAYRILTIQLTSVLSPFSISVPEWKLLGQLHDHGSMKLAKLANLLNVEAPLVTSLVDSLEKKKLVKRTNDKEDKRAKVIEVTKKGTDLVEKLEPEVKAAMRHLLRGVERNDFEGYIRVLELIVKNSSSS